MAYTRVVGAHTSAIVRSKKSEDIVSPLLKEKSRWGKGLVYVLYSACKQTAGTGAFLLSCGRGKRHRWIIWQEIKIVEGSSRFIK